MGMVRWNWSVNGSGVGTRIQELRRRRKGEHNRVEKRDGEMRQGGEEDENGW